jgi:hypothetical protein
MIPCYACLDQRDTPGDSASPARSSTPNRQETAHRLYSITNQKHTDRRAIIHEANKEI